MQFTQIPQQYAPHGQEVRYTVKHDAATMIPVAAAISRVENGAPADLREVTKGWDLFVG